jgi:hypothetical protein
MDPDDQRACGGVVTEDRQLRYCVVPQATGERVVALQQFFRALTVSDAWAALDPLRSLVHRIPGGH